MMKAAILTVLIVCSMTLDYYPFGTDPEIELRGYTGEDGKDYFEVGARFPAVTSNPEAYKFDDEIATPSYVEFDVECGTCDSVARVEIGLFIDHEAIEELTIGLLHVETSTAGIVYDDEEASLSTLGNATHLAWFEDRGGFESYEATRLENWDLTYKPTMPLTGFNGIDGSGTWKITGLDNDKDDDKEGEIKIVEIILTCAHQGKIHLKFDSSDVGEES